MDKVNDWNTVTADHLGCYVTVGTHKTGESDTVSPLFVPLSDCRWLAERLTKAADMAANHVPLNAGYVTRENARSVATKIQTVLSSLVIKAARELLADVTKSPGRPGEMVVGAREVASLQEAMKFKTGMTHGPTIQI